MDSQTKKLFVSYPKTTLNYIILADKKGGEIQNTNLDDRHSKHTKKLEQQATMAEGGRNRAWKKKRSHGREEVFEMQRKAEEEKY